ncbi:DUF6265 family protein [Marinilongibacter aquaticus]|uniref:DUF6265 family protein n=1 Tax=Marinilongibacter aquaticus TaxID=2975157 RepID=UPI0021BDE07D|nr:DUF6265 family protein [Marinilongibacter aquaticus]UBM58169.1 DUF6265 family protein [Marinilongibacter aquaticus]
MKTIHFALVTILLSSCHSATKKELADSENQSETFDWLLGNWERMHEEKGKHTFENWEKVSKNEYTGISFTMQNGDTIKQEKIRLLRQSDHWVLSVKVPEEKESIAFPVTELKSDAFLCTNDTLDFPKQIKYWKNGRKINAKVSGDALEIDFEFERID